MKKNTHRIPNSVRLPKVKTVNDLLTRDDINGILADLDEAKPDISDLIVIYMDKDKNRCFLITEDTLNSTATWLLETTKLDVIMEDTEEE
jgi:hypothetical protein